MFSSNDRMFQRSPADWSEGYFNGVLAVSANSGVDFEQVVGAGSVFQSAAFLNASGWLEHAVDAEFYCFGFTYGMYDSGSVLLRSEIVDIFDDAAFQEFQILTRRLMLNDNHSVLADFSLFYKERRGGV
jgi:hypothetical protein